MEHQASLQIFTITQLELGSPLIWEPAVGTAEHDRLVDAYIPGPANLQQKRATIALDFFDTAAASTMPAPFCRTYLVATNTPEFAAKPSYSPAFAPTSTYSPSTSASSASLSSKSSKRSISSLSSAASASPAKRLPGFSIMTADGVDITNNQSRGPKTKAQREQAAKMRKLGACPACKRSKQKCEPSHHRPAPMSATSSQNTSSVSSPWQSSGSASASTSPASRASISPQTSFGQSFSPTSHVPMASANVPGFSMAGDFVPGDWAFTSDQQLADNSNMPDLFSSFDFDAAAALDEDLSFFSAPASADHVFPHVQDRPNVQPRGFEGGAWYDDFVLSSYFNGGDADVSLSSAQASVGESSARMPSSASASPSTQTDTSHVPGGLERDRGLSPLASSGEVSVSSGTPGLDLFRDRSNVQAGELVVDGALWNRLQSDPSSPTHDPRSAAQTQQQGGAEVLDDLPDPVPLAEPEKTLLWGQRRRRQMPSTRSPAPTPRPQAHPIARTTPYTANLPVGAKGDLPPKRRAYAITQSQRLEHLKVLRDSRRDVAISSHRPPAASAPSGPPGRDTQVQAAVARYLVSSASSPVPSSLHAPASGEDGQDARVQAAVARYLVSSTSSPTSSALHAPASGEDGHATRAQAAVARYLVSSASSQAPSSLHAPASGEDGHAGRRDRHKALRKVEPPCACASPTAVPANSLCGNCQTPTSMPATVATLSRSSTNVLGGLLDGIRKRVLSFFGGGDEGGVEGLVQGMGRLGVV
ncbi:hypothetical protein V494_03317 [Pseudogymnoascus sp. VKM F-4513 (FW-928)]|nr:hypothetical protein V494_03317 [Pseudogymnoascus sp. VKM F-4513 (FW-928)]